MSAKDGCCVKPNARSGVSRMSKNQNDPNSGENKLTWMIPALQKGSFGHTGTATRLANNQEKRYADAAMKPLSRQIPYRRLRGRVGNTSVHRRRCGPPPQTGKGCSIWCTGRRVRVVRTANSGMRYGWCPRSCTKYSASCGSRNVTQVTGNVWP